MAQKLNGNELQSCYNGSQEIDKIMYGSSLVWENIKLIDLGTAQSFNIKNYTSNWANLTVNNFFMVGNSNRASINGIDRDDTIVYVTNDWEKSYSNGTLTFRIKIFDSEGRNAYAGVHAVMVEKIDKLIHLGSGQSFNAKSYSNWQDFTYKNFLMLKPSGYANHGVRTPESWSAYTEVLGSYSNGTFICKFYYRWDHENTGSTTPRIEADNMDVYLFPKKI